MIYSPLSGHIYCFCNSPNFIAGFNQWWKLNPKVEEHKKSSSHLDSLEKWRTLAVGIEQKSTIDDKNLEMFANEKSKWRNILHRIINIILKIVKMNLPFHGHHEDPSSYNRGVFLELAEFISIYDKIMKDHLEKVDAARGIRSSQNTSYLSPSTQNELIHVLGNAVKAQLINEIKEATYYGIMFDSIPDISKIDQMSEIIRYVHIDVEKLCCGSEGGVSWIF